MTNAETVDLCEVLGIPVKGHSSSLQEAYADMVRRRAVRDGLIRDEQPEEPQLDKKPVKKAAAPKKAAAEQPAAPKKAAAEQPAAPEQPTAPEQPAAETVAAPEQVHAERFDEGALAGPRDSRDADPDRAAGRR